MKRKMLIGHVLTWSLMSLMCSGTDNNNLECHTDFLEVITCVWNTSSAEDRFHITPTTNCSLKSHYEDYMSGQTPQSVLEPLGSSQPKLRKATLNFFKESLTEGSPIVQLFVWCEGMNQPLINIENFGPACNVKLYPPEKPLVTGANITWKRGSPHSIWVKDVKYELQWDLLENKWEKSQVASIEDDHCELPEEKLILGRKYVVRVRSTPKINSRFWSEWSPETQWTSTVGLQPPTEDPGYMMLGIFTNFTSLVIIMSVAVLLLAFSCILRNRRIMKCPYVPTPGNYFGDLFSAHGGDFKSWLGPIVNPELYIKPESECISPVTINKACNSDMPSNMMEKDFIKNDGNTSSFSNSTYFMSQSSKCANIADRLEPCSADCPYGPAGGGSIQEKLLPATHENGHDNELSTVAMSTPLETSSSYKQLQKLRLDIQSPDSGFAGSSEEQESQEESGSEGLPSPPVVDNTLPINCILPCPVPQQIGFPHLGIPPGLTWSPWIKQPFTFLPSGISRNILPGNFDIMPCAGILEPSSDDYMPVKKVQG